MDKQITSDERKRLAERLGVNEQYLYQCLTGRRDMNPAEAMRLEKESDGALTRQMLCQKSAMAIWPDLAHGSANGKPRKTVKQAERDHSNGHRER
jgi:DNA-binding transcriptional regulator YdaS (Cro superfamily)